MLELSVRIIGAFGVLCFFEERKNGAFLGFLSFKAFNSKKTSKRKLCFLFVACVFGVRYNESKQEQDSDCITRKQKRFEL